MVVLAGDATEDAAVAAMLVLAVPGGSAVAPTASAAATKMDVKYIVEVARNVLDDEA